MKTLSFQKWNISFLCISCGIIKGIIKGKPILIKVKPSFLMFSYGLDSVAIHNSEILKIIKISNIYVNFQNLQNIIAYD